jgi:hypothetical protein
MDLVRDVLDKKVIDRNGRDMGRADRIVLRLRPDGSPVVEAIEIGPVVLAGRVHPLGARWVAALLQAMGFDPQPLRIAWKDLEVNDHVRADLAFGETTAAAIEQRLRRVVGAIPRWS